MIAISGPRKKETLTMYLRRHICNRHPPQYVVELYAMPPGQSFILARWDSFWFVPVQLSGSFGVELAHSVVLVPLLEFSLKVDMEDGVS